MLYMTKQSISHYDAPVVEEFIRSPRVDGDLNCVRSIRVK